jgi:hypothetical protein
VSDLSNAIFRLLSFNTTIYLQRRNEEQATNRHPPPAIAPSTTIPHQFVDGEHPLVVGQQWFVRTEEEEGEESMTKMMPKAGKALVPQTTRL